MCSLTSQNKSLQIVWVCWVGTCIFNFVFGDWSMDASKRLLETSNHDFFLKLTKSCLWYLWLETDIVFFFSFFGYAGCNPHTEFYVHGLVQTDPLFSLSISHTITACRVVFETLMGLASKAPGQKSNVKFETWTTWLYDCYKLLELQSTTTISDSQNFALIFVL